MVRTSTSVECPVFFLVFFWTGSFSFSNKILEKALNLTPTEKAELIDRLLASLDNPDKELDKLWSKEAEDRIEAYERGEIRALTLKEVLEKYR